MSWFGKKAGEAAPQASSRATKPKKAANGKNGAAPGKVSAEEVQASVERTRRVQAAFGEVISVLMRSPQHQSLTLGQARALVAPAIATRQFLVASQYDATRRATAPVAVVMWANVSEELDRVLSTELDKPITLRPEQWGCGNIPWLVAAIGDQKVTQNLLNTAQQRSLKGRALKYRSTDKDGKVVVRTLQSKPANAKQS